MKIVSAQTRRCALPLKMPFVTALRRVQNVEFIVLEIATDTGEIAYGSAPSTEAITGETLESIDTALRTKIIPRILALPFMLEQLLALVASSVGGNSSAKAAMEMALYSLDAQLNHLALYQRLGTRKPVPIHTAVTVSLDTPEAMESYAIDLFTAGFDVLKIKVGASDGQDLQRIKKIAQALPDATLLIDANQGWSVDETLHTLDALESTQIALAEQPVAATDIEGMRTIRERTAIALLADEAVFHADDARRVLEAGAADLINIKLMKCGGISGALEILEICRAHSVKCMLGSMLEGPVSITAALHLGIACFDDFAWFDLDSPLLYRSLPSSLPFRVDGNRYTLGWRGFSPSLCYSFALSKQKSPHDRS